MKVMAKKFGMWDSQKCCKVILIGISPEPTIDSFLIVIHNVFPSRFRSTVKWSVTVMWHKGFCSVSQVHECWLFGLYRASVQARPLAKHTGRCDLIPSFRICNSHVGQTRSEQATGFLLPDWSKNHHWSASGGPASKQIIQVPIGVTKLSFLPIFWAITLAGHRFHPLDGTGTNSIGQANLSWVWLFVEEEPGHLGRCQK